MGAALTDRQVVRIATACALLPTRADLISDFNQQLVADLGERYRRHGRDAFVTDAEWAAFDFALSAMNPTEVDA